jgi:adiponectin receptor
MVETRRRRLQQESSNDINQEGDEKVSPEMAVKQPATAIRKLLHWDELPPWLRDNHHIHTGYRPASSSLVGSFQSLFYVHNETVNIYTHLLPSLITIPAAFWLYQVLAPRYASATDADITAFGCFFLGAAFCLSMSATYHTISNHSPSVARVGNALDYVGIVGLITGSFVPSVFYGFYCEPLWRRVYWSMIGTIGFGCTCVCLIPRFRTPDWRPFRAAMFVAMGLSAVFPVVHGWLLYGADRMTSQIGLYWLLLQGFLYILGATLYAARVPERLSPGSFDIVGSSHQIFHVLVVCAAVAHLAGLLRAFDYRHSGVAEACGLN